MKRVNINLKKEIHSQAKIISVLKNVPLNKYLELCIRKGVKDDQTILETIKMDDGPERERERERERALKNKSNSLTKRLLRRVIRC